MLHLSRRATLAGAAALPFAAHAHGAWPARPVRTVVAFAAGGPADIEARDVARWREVMQLPGVKPE